jgi:hypothetical protein
VPPRLPFDPDVTSFRASGFAYGAEPDVTELPASAYTEAINGEAINGEAINGEAINGEASEVPPTWIQPSAPVARPSEIRMSHSAFEPQLLYVS